MTRVSVLGLSHALLQNSIPVALRSERQSQWLPHIFVASAPKLTSATLTAPMPQELKFTRPGDTA